MQYIGKQCVHCQKIFTKDDDIVVCPECGSPHHRECYRELNKCALEELHAEGFSWKKTEDDFSGQSTEAENNPDSTVKCSLCEMPMPADAVMCPNCGEPNRNNPNADRDKGFRRIFGINPDSDMGGVSAMELIIFVRVNVLYYAAYFKQIALSKRKLSMNILCLFFPSVYFANRRMWLWAVISSIISVLLTIPYALVTLADMTTSGTRIFSERVMTLLAENSGALNSAINICNGLDFVFRLIFCLFANLLYYRFAVRSIKKMRENTGTEELTHADIARAGGVRLLNTPLIILVSTAMTMMAVYISVTVLENFL